MLSKAHVENICLAYAGHKTCRYLIYDQQTGKHLCCKKVPGLAEDVDKRIEVFLDKTNKDGQDLVMLGRPVGNNCQGYLYLKNAPQGFDIPGSA